MFYNISKKGEIRARIVYINGEVIERQKGVPKNENHRNWVLGRLSS
jgi:hypothetical protein